MSQYYVPVLSDAKGRKKTIYDVYAQFNVYCDWDTMPCLNLAKKIYKRPKRLVWVGDYVSNKDIDDQFMKNHHIPDNVMSFKPQSIWKKEKAPLGNIPQISLNGKFFANHDTKEFINIDEFRRVCGSKTQDGEWVPSPLCLLMAVGNDVGTESDYHNENADKVGVWAWNLVSVEDEPPKSYEKLTDLWFRGSCA